MRTRHLALTSLLAPIAWASPNFPMAFFVDVGYTIKPLSDALYDIDDDVSSLCYGMSEEVPIVFSLKNGYAVTEDTYTPGYLTIHNGVLGFGRHVTKTPLDFDRKMKVSNGPFQSCSLLSSDVRYIYHTPPKFPHIECFEVNIYLWPYGRKPGAIKPVPWFKKIKKHS